MATSPPAPKPKPKPKPVRIRCRDAAHIEREVERRTRSDSLFVPSEAPPPEGAEQEFRFYVPDGPEVSVCAKVLQSIPAEGSVGEMPGMLVSFTDTTGELALPAEATRRAGSAPRSSVPATGPPRGRTGRPAILPGPRESQPIHGVAERTRALQALHAELEALEGRSDAGVLGLEEEAGPDAVAQAFAQLSEQYATARFTGYGSKAIVEAAARIRARIEEAYRTLSEASGTSGAPPGQLYLTPSERANRAVSDAAMLLQSDRFVPAQQSLSSALRIDPRDTDARVWLLIAQARQAESWNDYDTAMARYRAALAVDSGHEVAGQGLARAAALAAGNAPAVRRGRIKRSSGA